MEAFRRDSHRPAETVQPPPAIETEIVEVKVRCRCLGCGAHVWATTGIQLYGSCSNCGGIDLELIESAEPHRAA